VAKIVSSNFFYFRSDGSGEHRGNAVLWKPAMLKVFALLFVRLTLVLAFEKTTHGIKDTIKKNKRERKISVS
jgi:hypothetical protein